jgi:hypothetical protein
VSGLLPSFPASPGTQDDRRPTTGASSKPCSGSPARVHPGAIFPTHSGFGILSSGASAAGPLKEVCLNVEFEFDGR